MTNIWLLAQASGEEAAPETLTSTPVTQEQETETTTVEPGGVEPTTQPAKKQQSPYSSLILLGLMFVAMYFILFRGPRKQRQQRKQMVQTLQKNDKVQTIGGIIGTVVDVRDDEITLKIDESNNTKIKILPTAIGKNLSGGKG